MNQTPTGPDQITAYDNDPGRSLTVVTPGRRTVITVEVMKNRLARVSNYGTDLKAQMSIRDGESGELLDSALLNGDWASIYKHAEAAAHQQVYYEEEHDRRVVENAARAAGTPTVRA